METLKDWHGNVIEVAKSKGGVLAVADPWNNVVRAGMQPWPAPELIQKIYQSRQVRAFADAELATATRKLGFYSDLQSLHSLPILNHSGKLRLGSRLTVSYDFRSNHLQLGNLWT